MTTTVAGSGNILNAVDGIGSNAQFRYPTGIAVNYASGNIYVFDLLNQRLRMVTPAGSTHPSAYPCRWLAYEHAGLMMTSKRVIN